MLNDIANFESNNLPSVPNASVPANAVTTTLDLSALFETGLKTLTPLPVEDDTLLPVLQSIDTKVTILVDRGNKSSPKEDSSEVTTAGRKSSEELQLERDRLELRRAELEEQIARNKARSEERERQQRERDEKDFTSKYQSFFDTLEKGGADFFRNPLNAIPQLRKLLSKPLGKLATKIKSKGNFKGAPEKNEDSSDESETSSSPIETESPSVSAEASSASESETSGDESDVVFDETPEDSDILDVEYTISDDPDLSSPAIAEPQATEESRLLSLPAPTVAEESSTVAPTVAEESSTVAPAVAEEPSTVESHPAPTVAEESSTVAPAVAEEPSTVSPVVALGQETLPSLTDWHAVSPVGEELGSTSEFPALALPSFTEQTPNSMEALPSSLDFVTETPVIGDDLFQYLAPSSTPQAAQPFETPDSLVESSSLVDVLYGEPEQVAGGSEEKKRADEQYAANQLLVDTLSAPEDSEFVQALSDPASLSGSSNLSNSSSGGVVQAVAAAGIVALLAPHMEKIIGLVEGLLNFATGKLYDTLLLPMYQNILEPIGQEFLSVLDSLTEINKAFTTGILPYIPGIASALGAGFIQFISDGSNLLHAISSSIIEFFNDPVGTLSKVGDAVGSMLSTAILSVLTPLSDEIVVGFKEILPSWLGGFDDKTKQRLMDERVERVNNRRNSVDSVGGAAAQTFSTNSMSVYAANVALAENRGVSTGNSVTNQTSNTATVNVINSIPPAAIPPGGRR